jgi:type II secretory pathway component PulF
MFSTKILIKIIFKNDLLFIFNDFNQTKKTLENFNNSYLKFNFFLKFLITGYIILCFFLNIIFIIIFFYKLKINFFGKINQFLKKIPLVKNVQNFIIANLLLHTN